MPAIYFYIFITLPHLFLKVKGKILKTVFTAHVLIEMKGPLKTVKQSKTKPNDSSMPTGRTFPKPFCLH